MTYLECHFNMKCLEKAKRQTQKADQQLPEAELANKHELEKNTELFRVMEILKLDLVGKPFQEWASTKKLQGPLPQ